MNYNIQHIEELTEEEVKAISEEKTEIKGHAVYFATLGDTFGYSALVFCNGQHIYYANDYALHHPNKDREQLKKWYIETLNRKLFTEQELISKSADYSEYDRKRYFLNNYYGMRAPHISQFRYTRTDEERKAVQEKIKNMIYNPVCMGYYSDLEFVNKCVLLFNTMVEINENKNDVDYWVNAFIVEMANHEYQTNLQGDFDVISAFANVAGVEDYENISALMDAAEFSEVQKNAYLIARKEYLKNAEV